MHFRTEEIKQQSAPVQSSAPVTLTPSPAPITSTQEPAKPSIAPLPQTIPEPTPAPAPQPPPSKRSVAALTAAFTAAAEASVVPQVSKPKPIEEVRESEPEVKGSEVEQAPISEPVYDVIEGGTSKPSEGSGGVAPLNQSSFTKVVPGQSASPDLNQVTV